MVDTRVEWMPDERRVGTHYANNIPVESAPDLQPTGLITSVNLLREALDQAMTSTRRIMTGLFGPNVWPDRVDVKENVQSPGCFAEDLVNQVFVAQELAARLCKLENLSQA